MYTRLAAHLRHSHQIKSPLRRSVVAEYKDCVVAQIEDDVAPLPDGSPPLDFLAPPFAVITAGNAPSKRSASLCTDHISTRPTTVDGRVLLKAMFLACSKRGRH